MRMHAPPARLDSHQQPCVISRIACDVDVAKSSRFFSCQRTARGRPKQAPKDPYRSLTRIERFCKEKTPPSGRAGMSVRSRRRDAFRAVRPQDPHELDRHPTRIRTPVVLAPPGHSGARSPHRRKHRGHFDPPTRPSEPAPPRAVSDGVARAKAILPTEQSGGYGPGPRGNAGSLQLDRYSIFVRESSTPRSPSPRRSPPCSSPPWPSAAAALAAKWRSEGGNDVV